MKGFSHRLPDGRCRGCGRYDSWSAPDSCTRCAIDRMRALQYEIVYNPIAQFVQVGDETWRYVSHAIQTDSVKSDRFYLFAGHNDGGPLALPLGDQEYADYSAWEFASGREAHRKAQELTQRYPQVWVVTTTGCWNAIRPAGVA